MASSSALGSPVCSLAFRAASSCSRVDGAPAGLQARSSRTTPTVSVPVLSVHSVSIAPKFSMAARRRTITPPAAMRWAPRASVRLMTAGSSSGARPTASATANISESVTGRS